MSLLSKKSSNKSQNESYLVVYATFSGILQLLLWISFIDANWQSEKNCKVFQFSYLGIILIDLMMTIHQWYRLYHLMKHQTAKDDESKHPLILLLVFGLGITLLIIRKNISNKCKHEAYMAYIMSGIIVSVWILIIVFGIILLLFGFFVSSQKESEVKEPKVIPKKGFYFWSRNENV